AIARENGLSLVELSLAWLLAQPGVTSVIVGGRNRAQVLSALRAAHISLSPEVLTCLSEVTRPLKEKLGSNPDMWQSDPRIS
ncbi:MAG TPA: aldo/keto reductase, partial [bacterium]|nr:aldo/keto reductase [bacterium]